MTDKKSGPGKIGRIESTDRTTGVKGAEAVGEVDAVKATGAVGAVTRAGAVKGRSAVNAITPGRRDELYRLIQEEAEKIFAASKTKGKRKEEVIKAVKMAVDMGMAANQEEDAAGKKPAGSQEDK